MQVILIEDGGISLEKLLEQINAYELLNNLIPGAVLYALVGRHTGDCSRIDHVILELFICYFIGLIAGWFGSLVIEPLFKKLKIIRMADYGEFVTASRKDSKIKTLSGINNMYRTFAAVFVIYAICVAIERITIIYPALRPWLWGTGIVLLILLFSLSYRKQTKYIVARIKKQEGNEEMEETRHEI